MTFLLFFETIFRSLVTMAQASWRRTYKMKWRIVKWTWFYVKNSTLLLVIMLIFPRRAVIFWALYAWFRSVDDILDNENPSLQIDIKLFIKNKRELITRFENHSLQLEQVTSVDRLLVIILRFSEELVIKEEIKKYVPMIWKHMLDEYEWRTNKIIPTAFELDEFARSQDQAIFYLLSRL